MTTLFPTTTSSSEVPLPGGSAGVRAPWNHVGSPQGRGRTQNGVMDADEELESNDGSDRADWIRDRLVGFGEGVFSLVPAGFPAYVRLFHPAYEDPGAPDGRQLRWAGVSERAGTTMHALRQFAPLRAVPWSDVNLDLTFPRERQSRAGASRRALWGGF